MSNGKSRSCGIYAQRTIQYYRAGPEPLVTVKEK